MVQKKTATSRPTKSLADKLLACGIDASRGQGLTQMDPAGLVVARTPGHPLYDRRGDPDVTPLRPDRIAYTMIHGTEAMPPIVVLDSGEREGRPILEVCDGRRRTLHTEAVNRLCALPRNHPDVLAFLEWCNGPEGTDASYGGLEIPFGNTYRVPVIRITGGYKKASFLAMVLNAREDETIGSRADKASNALAQGHSDAQVMHALGVSKDTFRAIKLYLGLEPPVQAAIDDGRIGAGAIPDLAKVPRIEQAKQIAKLEAAGVTKNHEVRAGLDSLARGGEVKTTDRKRLPTRRELEALRDALAENKSSCQEVMIGFALTSFMLGDATALDVYKHLTAALTAAGIVLSPAKRRAA